MIRSELSPVLAGHRWTLCSPVFHFLVFSSSAAAASSAASSSSPASFTVPRRLKQVAGSLPGETGDELKRKL